MDFAKQVSRVLRPDVKASPRPAVNWVVRGYRGRLGFMAFVAFLGGSAEALFLVIATRTIFALTEGDGRVGLVADHYVTIDTALAAAALLVCIRVGLAIQAAHQAAELSSRAVARVRDQLVVAFLGASWPTQQAQRGGSLQELSSNYSGQASTLMAGVNLGLVSGANLVALLGLAIFTDPLTAALLVGAALLLGALLRPLRAAVGRRAKYNAQSGLELAQSIHQIASLGLELQVFNVQDQAESRVRRIIDVNRGRNRDVIFAAGLVTPAYLGMAYLSLVAGLVVVQVSTSTSLTSLGAAMLLMLRSLSYGQAVQSAIVSLSSAAPQIDELRSQLERLESGRRTDGGQPVPPMDAITVEDVSFSYVEGQQVLTGLSFEIRAREVVGIVGPSGVGKSTLVQLLLGLRTPTTGHIRVGPHDIDEFSRAEWARNVTFVPQRAQLIRGSIADNIRFFREDATDEAVERAARLAHLHDEIAAFPEQYDRDVGEAGGHLSGGQQQRLCIARALVERPQVLILDEPTSALDVQSELLVRTTLQELSAQMTVIIIAHRPSTLEICDRILILERGGVAAFDEPQEIEAPASYLEDAEGPR